MSDTLVTPEGSGLQDATSEQRTVGPRVLVPSERQQREGAELLAVPEQVAVVAEPEVTRMRRWMADADPRVLLGKGRTLPVVVIGLSALFSGWDDAAFGLLLPEIQDEFALDLGFIVAMGTIVGVVKGLVAPAIGYLADRVRRTRMLAVGEVIANGGSIIAGLAGSVPLLASSRAVGGLGESMKGPSLFPLLTDWFPLRERGRIVAFLGLAGGVGGLIGPVVAGQLADRFGWRVVMLTLGGLATAVSLLFFWLKEPIRGAYDRAAVGVEDASSVPEQPPVSWSEGWRAARSIATLRRIWYATPFLGAAGAVSTSLMSIYFAREFGLSPGARGWIAAVNVAFVMVFLPFGGSVVDRLIGTRPARIFSLLGLVLTAQALSLVVLAVSPNVALSIAINIPVTVGGAMMYPALIALPSLVIPARMRAFGLASVMPWQILGSMIVVGLTFYMDDDIRRTFLMLVPIYLVGTVLIATAGGGVKRDMRAALAASMADEEARRARARGGNKMLILRDIDVTYGGTQAVFNLDLDIEEGEMIALLGTNGAGKSSVLRAIAGIQEASNGAIFLDGEDITHRPTHEIARLGVVFMPGGQAIFSSLTVAENLEAARWMNRKDEGGPPNLEQVLDLFPELNDRLHEPAGNLSGGEQQMVALGQAFLMQPRLLMIDELSLGLAPAVVERLLDIVRRINADGTTIMLVEQSVNVAVTLARRALFMERGEIRFDGSTGELVGRHDLVRSVFLAGDQPSPVAMGGGLLRPTREFADVDVLNIAGIRLSYGGHTVLNGIDLDVRAGEVLGLIGPNGAGKTSLFDVVTGHTRPDDGTVAVRGTDVTGLSPDARARLGLARSFQAARLWPSMTVRENVAVALEQHLAVRSAVAAATWLPTVRRSERRVARRVDHLIELFHLGTYAEKFVRELSTGTRRMVDMACVMAAQPAILLLDEPSSGVAQAEVEVFAPIVRRLAKETGCGIVVIEHDMPLLSALSDRMAALVLGSVVATGVAADVLRDPLVVEAYLGADEAVINRSGTSQALLDHTPEPGGYE